MTNYNERAQQITDRYNDRLREVEDAIRNLHTQRHSITAERDNELDALERTWAAEHGFPVGARVEVDFDGYLAWRKANGYTVPPLIKPSHTLTVSSVTREKFVMVARRGFEGELLLGVGTVPAQFVTVVDDG